MSDWTGIVEVLSTLPRRFQEEPVKYFTSKIAGGYFLVALSSLSDCCLTLGTFHIKECCMQEYIYVTRVLLLDNTEGRREMWCHKDIEQVAQGDII